MKKNTLKIQDFSKKLNKSRLIEKLVQKNLKGGTGDTDYQIPPFE